MDRRSSSRSRPWVVGIAIVAAGGLLPAQEAPPLKRVMPALRIATGEAALRSCDGRQVGTWRLEGESALLRPEGKPEVVAPRLQRWMASPRGSVLAGIGDPRAPEHPFELQVAVLRDGELVATLDELLGMESELTVGRGAVGVAGYRAGERGKPFALALQADGSELYRHALPEGMLARDPVLLFDDALLVRVHGVLGEGSDGAIVRVDRNGVRTLLDVPAIDLVGFAAARALVRTRDELIWYDSFDERVLWRRPSTLRPAGPHAWTLWSTETGDALAVVTSGLRRRGEPEPAVALELLDPLDGAPLGSMPLEATGPPAEVDLDTSFGSWLFVDWRGAQEVFTWNR